MDRRTVSHRRVVPWSTVHAIRRVWDAQLCVLGFTGWHDRRLLNYRERTNLHYKLHAHGLYAPSDLCAQYNVSPVTLSQIVWRTRYINAPERPTQAPEK